MNNRGLCISLCGCSSRKKKKRDQLPEYQEKVDIEELEIEHDREYHAKRIQYMEKKCSLMEAFLDRLDSLLAIEREQLEEERRFHALWSEESNIDSEESDES